MSRLGFVLLTHFKPHQTKHLVSRLNTMFDSPPIVLHHDFGKPEESYFQTVLYNAPQFNFQFDNMRYIDWSGPTWPKSLTLSDLAKIQASPAHFARKIDIDSNPDLLDALDRIIDGDTSEKSSTEEKRH